MIKVLNDIERGPLANVISLHDFDSSESDVKGWFSYVVDWFRANGLEPTRIGLTGSLYKGDKTIMFRNGLKRLEENDYKAVEGISLYATPPNHSIDMFDGIFSLVYRTRGKGDFVVCWDNQIAPFTKEYCQQLINDICAFLKPRYGYAFQRLFKQGPSFYPFGIIGGDNLRNKEEEAKLIKWNNEYVMSDGSYKTGDLRDIYPLNILSEAHLKRTINGHPFKEWIEATPQRGTLERITDTLWTWWVEPDQIDSIRKALAPSGIILCL